MGRSSPRCLDALSLRAGTVAHETFDARPVVGDAEAVRALPREHAGVVGLVEEPVTTELAKAAARSPRVRKLPTPSAEGRNRATITQFLVPLASRR
jgi:hypothetical protein